MSPTRVPDDRKVISSPVRDVFSDGVLTKTIVARLMCQGTFHPCLDCETKALAQPRRLFPFERVFDAADSVLNLALDLVGLAFRLQLCVTNRLANRLLHRTFNLLRRSDDAIFVHDFILKNLATPINEIGALTLA